MTEPEVEGTLFLDLVNFSWVEMIHINMMKPAIMERFKNLFSSCRNSIMSHC